jgi:hypothetical protein
MKKIFLTKGMFTLVDDGDFDYLNQWKWHLSAKGYAVRKPKNKAIFMHRLLNRTPLHMQTDHINDNKLDNRKENLRSVTNQQNHFNMLAQKNSKSGIRGVSWSKERKKWVAQIIINNKTIGLGRFFNLKDAIYARKKAEKVYFV